MKLLILGAGFSGKAIASICAPQFKQVFGTTRSEKKFAEIEKTGATPIAFDGATISPALAAALKETTHIVQSISPDDDGDGFLNRFKDLRALAPNLKWVGYLST